MAKKFSALLGIGCLLLVASPALSAPIQHIVNGDFETGDFTVYPVAECSSTMTHTQTANPRTRETPACLPACSYASGIIVLASIIRIAPAANVWTNDNQRGDKSLKRP